jgi:hypothetical protein
MHNELLQSATIRRYLTRRLACYRLMVGVSDSDCFVKWSKELMRDVILVFSIIPQNVPSACHFEVIISEPCRYHEHKGTVEEAECHDHRRGDSAFMSSFLRACIEKVYKVEKRRHHIEANDSREMIGQSDTKASNNSCSVRKRQEVLETLSRCQTMLARH